MRILLTTHVFLPEHSAGTEVLTFNTAKELQRQGHEVEVCTGYLAKAGLSDFQRFDTYECEGIQVNRFFHSPVPMGGQENVVEAEYNNLFFARWFRSYLVLFKPDIVHFFHLGLLSASTIDVCSGLDIPMVMTPTDFWLVCPNNQLRLPDNSLCRGPEPNSVNCIKHAVTNTQNPYFASLFNKLPTWMIAAMIWAANHGALSWFRYASMVRALYHRAGFLRQRMNMLDKVIVPTRLMEEMLVANGLNPDKVIFSRFGVRPTPSEAHVEDVAGRVRIGFIGGLSEHKGAHLLIGAIRLLSAGLPLELKIYGKTDDYPLYVEQLELLANADPRIRFLGIFPNEIISKIFSELDVLVVPSIWYENTPLVIYSAQAAGCPVIASNLGGMSEVVKHEENGLLFEAGDVAGLASMLERVVRDRGLLQRLAGSARKPKPIADYVVELQGIYEGVLQERRGGM